MRRSALGWIVVLLLVASCVLHLWFPSEFAVRDGCLRIGLVLAVVWLAFPQLMELPRWAIATTLSAVVMVMWKPKLLLFALPALVVMWFLRPRGRRYLG